MSQELHPCFAFCWILSVLSLWFRFTSLTWPQYEWSVSEKYEKIQQSNTLRTIKSTQWKCTSIVLPHTPLPVHINDGGVGVQHMWKAQVKVKKTMTAIVSQLCLSQCMASKWCNNSYRLVRSITTTSFEHLWCWLVSPSFINPFHTNCRILKYPIRKDISHHIYEYILPIFSLSMCYIAGALDSVCWHWNTLEWCQLNAFQASSVMHLVF